MFCWCCLDYNCNCNCNCNCLCYSVRGVVWYSLTHCCAWGSAGTLELVWYSRGEFNVSLDISGSTQLCAYQILLMTRTRIIAMRCYASAAYAVMRCPSVCLSVHPSVTFVNSVKTSKHIFNKCVSKTHISPYAQLNPGGVVHGPLKGSKSYIRCL